MREERPKLIKSEMKSGDNNKREGNLESSGTILRTYTEINWKILKKWTNF
jgi:hypothetical protein